MKDDTRLIKAIDELNKRVDELNKTVAELNTKIAIINERQIPIEKIVYGIVGLILVAAVTAIIKGAIP